MVDKTERGAEVRRSLLEFIDGEVPEAPKIVADQFGITRQAVNKHLARLVRDGLLMASGTTRARKYALAAREHQLEAFDLKDLEEDRVWTEHVRPLLAHLPANVLNIWHHGVTEMVNNAIDHSGGVRLELAMRRSALWTELYLRDDGVGIFRKIQQALDLPDERHAVLELTKGKLTTDPKRHSGEGIFFTSRMFDRFDLLSGSVHLAHEIGDGDDWVLERSQPGRGTGVFLRLRNDSTRTTKQIFDRFSGGEDYAFTKTTVPVGLAQHGGDQLVSRSQAKRLLARFQQFETVVLDFAGVEAIGQAFADEIFRVWAAEHSGTRLMPVNENASVQRMIARARAALGQAAK